MAEVLEDAFAATLAHELREPLSAIFAAVEVVRVAPATDAARRASDIMRRRLEEMSRLVDDLVDAKRLACGKVSLHKSRLDLRDVMRDAVADVEGAVADNGQEFLFADEHAPIWLDADRPRLLQAVLNLLRNAVKFTQPGGRITMAVERAASTVTLRIADTGRGIEADALPHIFDLFSQARPQEGAGLGIGLSIVCEIVLLHGGSVEARSEGAWQGSEFMVRLPIAALPAHAPETRAVLASKSP